LGFVHYGNFGGSMKKFIVFFLISNGTFLLNSSGTRHVDCVVQPPHVDCVVQIPHLVRMLNELNVSEDQQTSLLQRLQTESLDKQKSPKEIVDDVVSAKFPGTAFTLKLQAACRIYVAAQRAEFDHNTR
jgi:hypothetical protein